MAFTHAHAVRSSYGRGTLPKTDRCTSGRTRREWRDRMNSLEITAYKAYAAHRKAFDTWDNGNIDKIWLDDNKDICIKYTSGKWWHYSVSKSGEWMWW